MRRFHHVFAPEAGGERAPLTITSLGHAVEDRHYRCPEGRPVWVLLYFETPAVVLVRSQRRAVPAQTAVVFPPGQPLYYGGDHGFRHSWLCVRGDAVTGWTRAHQVALATPIPCRTVGFFSETLRLIDGELTAEGEPHARLLANLFENLLIVLAREARSRRPPTGDQRLLAARRHLETHFPGPIRLGDLAAVAGLSTSRFSHAFQAAFGVAPIELLIRVRLEAARQRLWASVDRVSDIARDVGFGDPVHFGKCFAQRFGLSPLAFRRSRKTPAAAR